MFYKGKQIDPISLWTNFCEIKQEGEGPFLPLVMCPNPDHDNSHSPAFQINIERPMVHCFSGCGISGSYAHAICVIGGIYEKRNITEHDLENSKKRRVPSEPVEVRTSRAKVFKARREAEKIILRTATVSFSGKSSINARKRKRAASSVQPEHELDENVLGNYSYLPKPALTYLRERGIDEASRSRWQIGFNEETERLTIPVRDSRKRLKFIIERGIYKSQRPAYLYPEESVKSSLLFGACVLDRAMIRSQGLIVVEGSFDAIMQHQHGFRNTVAILGNSLSRKQMLEIVRINPPFIYLFLDPDAAGVRGIEKATSMLEKKYPIKIPLYPKHSGKIDPGSLNKKQATRAIEQAIPVLRLKNRLRKVRQTN